MNYQYFGLFLDEPTRNKLMQVIIGNPIICNLVFQRGSTIYLDPCFGTYSEKGMLESISKRTSFYKDGIVYQKPHIILEFSERHDESIYFDSDEEMEGWLESFRQEFGKPFIYIE